jgi:hypothetical protein
VNTQEKLDYLLDTLVKLKDAEAELQKRVTAPVDKYFLGKIDEWASKILGVTSGYDAEFKQMYKHRIEKYRTLVAGHADVTIGEPDEVHAKSVQLKSTIGDHSDVSSMIKVALNQLSGERGELPRPKDRLVVDMYILSAENTWPGGAHTLGTLNWRQYVETAQAKILSLCAESGYRQHIATRGHKQEGHGISPALRGHLTDLSLKHAAPLSHFPYMEHRNSTQLIAPVHGLHPSQGEKVIHLTFKIRYHFGYPIVVGRDLLTGEARVNFLHAAVFNVFRVGPELRIHLTKAINFSDSGGFTRINL